jgi:hypothetical protein
MEAKSITGNKGGMEGKADVVRAAKKPEPAVQRTASRELIARVCRTAKTRSEVDKAITEIKGMGDWATLHDLATGEMGELKCEGRSVADLVVKAMIGKVSAEETVSNVIGASRILSHRLAAVSVLEGNLDALLRLCARITLRFELPISGSERSPVGEAIAKEINKIAASQPERAEGGLSSMQSTTLAYIVRNLCGAQPATDIALYVMGKNGHEEDIACLAKDGMKEVAAPASKALAQIRPDLVQDMEIQRLKWLVLDVIDDWDGRTPRVPRPEWEMEQRQKALEALTHLKDDVSLLVMLVRELKGTREFAASEVVDGAGIPIRHLVYATVLKYLAIKMASGELSEAEWLKIVGQ